MKNQDFDNEVSNKDDDQCDIYVSKVCDNCGECLGIDGSDYKVIRIDGIFGGKDDGNGNTSSVELEDIGIDLDEYLLEDTTLDKLDEFEDRNSFDVEYIEDIPELKEEYEKKLDKLLGRE